MKFINPAFTAITAISVILGFMFKTSETSIPNAIVGAVKPISNESKIVKQEFTSKTSNEPPTDKSDAQLETKAWLESLKFTKPYETINSYLFNIERFTGNLKQPSISDQELVNAMNGLQLLSSDDNFEQVNGLLELNGQIEDNCKLEMRVLLSSQIKQSCVGPIIIEKNIVTDRLRLKIVPLEHLLPLQNSNNRVVELFTNETPNFLSEELKRLTGSQYKLGCKSNSCLIKGKVDKEFILDIENSYPQCSIVGHYYTQVPFVELHC